MTAMELAHYNKTPSHTIHPGARIKVETKTGRGFAWATSRSEFPAAIQLKEIEQKKIKGMRLFLAMAGFTVCYPEHDYREVFYDIYTRIYAFSKPEDGLVTKIPPPKKKWEQDALV